MSATRCIPACTCCDSEAPSIAGYTCGPEILYLLCDTCCIEMWDQMAAENSLRDHASILFWDGAFAGAESEENFHRILDLRDSLSV